MKISLIIATYNSPRALEASLSGVLVQSRLPDEVIIADDGSTEETRRVIERFGASTDIPVRHVWHPDKGFRLAMIRNKAIAAACGDYILQIDGDIMLHPDFVADHEKHARAGRFACGSRVMLRRPLTEQILNDKNYMTIQPWTRGISNRKNAIRSQLMSGFFRMLYAARLKYRGCNMAFWRTDLLDVNGYDESYEGWGCEDHDLVARLMNNGVMPMQLRNAAICYHLWHPSSKESDSFLRNNARLEETRRLKRIRSLDGIDKYLTVPSGHLTAPSNR